jgi:hypothetical protein
VALNALLGAHLEVLGAPRTLVGALEVPDEGPSEVGLVMYRVSRHMFELGPHRFMRGGQGGTG